jgi:hypothetical protein
VDRGRFADRLKNDIAPHARSIDVSSFDAATAQSQHPDDLADRNR